MPSDHPRRPSATDALLDDLRRHGIQVIYDLTHLQTSVVGPDGTTLDVITDQELASAGPRGPDWYIASDLFIRLLRVLDRANRGEITPAEDS